MIQFNVGNFFDKFKNAALKEMRTRTIIVESIEKIAGVKIEPKDVQLKNKIIKIQTNPAARNHIFTRKEAILENIRTQLPEFIVSDLR